MARASHTVKVRLEAEDAASAQLDKSKRSFEGFATSVKVAFAAAVAGALSFVGVLKSVVSAAQKQQDAVKALDSSLTGLGSRAASVSKELQEQAAALQKVSRFSDETVIKNQALLKTMGVSEDKLKLATQASVDLAAAFGWTLEQAARNVGRTMGGFAGELGEIVPELKNLDAAALRAGAGVELLAQKFAGRAQDDVRTFSGLIIQMGNAWGDLKERVGLAIIENEKLIDSLSRLRDTMSEGALPAAISSVAEKTATFTTNSVEEVTSVQNVTLGLRALITEYVNLGNAIQHRNEMSELERQTWNFLLGGLPILYERLKELGQATRELDGAEANLEKQNEALAAAFEKDILAILNTGKSVSDLKAEFQALTEAQQAEIDSSDAFLASLERIGVVLDSQVNVQIERNNSLLTEAQALYLNREITLKELEAIEQGVARANAELTESMREQNEVVSESPGVYESAATGLSFYREEATRTIGVVNQLATAVGAANSGVSGGIVRSAGGSQQILAGLQRGPQGELLDALGRRVHVDAAGGGWVGPGGPTMYAQEWTIEWAKNVIAYGQNPYGAVRI